MARGYWIASIDVTDPDRYPEYVRLDTPVIEKFGGRFVVRGGAYEAVEGTARSRHVVIEFPSYRVAMECYESPAYQEAAAIRRAASDSDILIVEGLPDAPAAPSGGGYWLVRLDVHDPEALGAYAQKAGPYLAGIGANYLVRAGQMKAPEAAQRAVAVLVAFPSYDAALSAYRAEEYQPLIAQRQAATDGEFLIVEGAA
jgi:uncharacterized protein (DUF1330 family)